MHHAHFGYGQCKFGQETFIQLSMCNPFLILEKEKKIPLLLRFE